MDGRGGEGVVVGVCLFNNANDSSWATGGAVLTNVEASAFRIHKN